MRYLWGLFCALPVAAFAQVVIDGTTATTVNLAADGRVTVGLAPTTPNGVSLNRFQDFNVDAQGVDLDNRETIARTIVSEVTGVNPTRINGAVTVLGQRAHVITANPNGISIDGGRFVNVARAAFATGATGENQVQIAPGIFQTNVTADINGGTIIVGAGGLSGEMDAIELLAEQLRFEGPLDTPNDGSLISLRAGTGRAQFDSAVIPGNTAANWSSFTATGGNTGNASITLGSTGGLSAGRISVAVNGSGAGVRMGNTSRARSGNFILTSDGDVVLDGATVTSKNTTSINAGSLSSDDTTIDVEDGDLLIDVAAWGDKGGDYRATGALSFAASAGGVTLTDTQFRAGDAILFDVVGDLRGVDLSARSGGHVLGRANSFSITGMQTQAEMVAENGSFVLTTTGAAGAGNFAINNALVQGGAEVEGVSNAADLEAAGAVTLDLAGDLTLLSGEDLAILFGLAGDLDAKIGGGIDNTRGRIVANGDMRLDVAETVVNRTTLPGARTEPIVERYTRKGKRQWWTLFLRRSRETGISYDYGVVDKPAQVASLTASGGIDIRADIVSNTGGTINANGGDVLIEARQVETIGIGAGRFYLNRVCTVWCSYTSGGDFQVFGGQINASENADITATERFENRGGAVYAINDITLTTPDAELEAVMIPRLVTRPRGLYNFWSSKAAWLFLRDEFGSIIADTGNLRVRSNNPVRLLGGQVSAGGELDIPNGSEPLRDSDAAIEIEGRRIGVFQNIAPVTWN